MKLNKLLVILALILTSSCLNKTDDKERFTDVIKDMFAQEEIVNVDYVIIIPNHGCSGCITVLEEFYNENNKRNNIIFVFTNIISSKILKQKVEINESNTYLDFENSVLRAYPDSKQIYPCFLEIKGGIVKEIYYQSAEENGLSVVKNKLKNK